MKKVYGVYISYTNNHVSNESVFTEEEMAKARVRFLKSIYNLEEEDDIKDVYYSEMKLEFPPDFVRIESERLGEETKKSTNISDRSQKLFDRFDKLARNWGWAEDQGTKIESEESEHAYKHAKRMLLEHINDLENNNLKIK
jgi:hypothetical protein